MKRQVRLGVNIDHVATVRQARRGRFPDPILAATVCERAGASSIVCHLREDRRHIQDEDVLRLRRSIKTCLNLEMSIAPSVVRVALAVRPAQVTLVPERRKELTTEGGLDIVRQFAALRRVIRRFHERRIDVSLFIDPNAAQIAASGELGVGMVELHTGAYADAATSRRRLSELRRLETAARSAHGTGLAVAAGHGLNYRNVGAVARIPEVEELNIGFSIIGEALFVGLENAVRHMIVSMNKAGKALHGAKRE